jgi:Lon-like protease
VNNLPPPVYVPMDNPGILRDDQAARRGRVPWWTIPLAIVGVLGALVALSWAIKVDYYGLAPGGARATEPLVETTQQTYESDGALLYTTVSVRQLSLFEWASYGLGFNDDTDVIPEETYTGGRSQTELREEGRQAMGASKDTALFVALERLGNDVTIGNGGALITSIDETVPAFKTLKEGDIIIEINGTAISIGQDIRPALGATKPGEEVDAVVVRADVEVKVRFALADRGDGTAYIGISTDLPDGATFDFPVDISIDSGGVGGPSAGLAFTLGVLDALTPGDLTGGNKVAVTGTIDANGLVGPIGGIRQKAIAARDAGATLFIVPASVTEELAGDIPPGLTVVGVETVDDALGELAKVGGNVNELPVLD